MGAGGFGILECCCQGGAEFEFVAVLFGGVEVGVARADGGGDLLD